MARRDRPPHAADFGPCGTLLGLWTTRFKLDAWDQSRQILAFGDVRSFVVVS